MLQEFFADVSRRTDEALDKLIPSEQTEPTRLYRAIRHSIFAGGKRFRPALVMAAGRVFDVPDERLLSAASAVEMIHTYSLIHDDLPAMDDDDMRRGRPTCHVAFGEATAILAGDALLAQAFEILARDTQPGEVAARCVAELARAAGASELVGGQEDDLKAEFTNGGLEHLERIHRRKTGAMIRVSLRLGGLVAQATDSQLAALDVYGEKIGLAFQIVDDLLDLTGDEAAMGKRLQKDSTKGKLTFPAVLGEAESRRRAAALIDEACSAVAVFGDRSAGLEALARYVVDRNH